MAHSVFFPVGSSTLLTLHVVRHIETECATNLQNYPGGFYLEEEVHVQWCEDDGPEKIVFEDSNRGKLTGYFPILGIWCVFHNGVVVEIT